MSLSHEPGSADQENPIPEGYTEIPSGSIAVIQSADLGKGKEVSIMTRQGAMPFCTIKRNAPGNRFEPADPDATFTLIFPAGDELLLKIPSVQHRTNSYFIDTQKYSAYFGKSAPFIGDRHIRLDIVSDGSLQIADMGDPHGAIYSVVEKPEPEPYIRYISPEKRILTTEWSQLDLMEADHLSVFYDQESKSAGTLYKLPHRSGYVFRDNSNKSKKTLSPGGTEEFTVTTSAQHTLHIKIEGGKALARADSPIRVETYGVDLFRQTDAGCDGSFGDYINGGRSFYAISFREAGPSKYRFANEDNVGCNIKTGRLVLADGLGANGNGQHASALAVRDIANNPGPFRKA
ncbi:MAG TPA: hypothetical protein VI588_03100, partial [Candidatus Gracilibacteria bacterium]|nr:hypothetical protein [Candidatus Gracilibacteria bacterium]